MIHTLLQLSRPLFVIDTETTGLSVDDRIIELGFQKWTSEGMVLEYRTLINPEIPIPPAATAIHGITDETIRACQTCGVSVDVHNMTPQGRCERLKIAPTFAQLAPNLVKGLFGCDYAGKNVRFDLRMLDAEFRRAKVHWTYASTRILDADRLEALALPRDLGSLHEKYTGAKHDGAHGALSDVRATATVIMEQLVTHGGLPRDLDQLHALSWPGWLTACGRFRMVEGVPTVMFGKKYNNVPMAQVPTSYWDWLLGADFPEDVCVLASNAKLGKYPE